MPKDGIWMFSVVLALAAGWTDWRSRRIPNWLTVPGLLLGIIANAVAFGWLGAKASLLGACLGLAVLLPFVALRSLGAGDWKLVGALGAWLGPYRLIEVLVITVLIAALMALFVILTTGRVRRTVHNLARMAHSLIAFRMPPAELTLDDPSSAKIPFGIAVAVAMVLYTGAYAAHAAGWSL